MRAKQYVFLMHFISDNTLRGLDRVADQYQWQKITLPTAETIGFLKLTFQPLLCFGTNIVYKLYFQDTPNSPSTSHKLCSINTSNNSLLWELLVLWVNVWRPDTHNLNATENTICSQAKKTNAILLLQYFGLWYITCSLDPPRICPPIS